MEIIDFMICSGSLAKYNYVLVQDCPENIAHLKKMGCTDKEIESMRDDDNYLDPYTVLKKKNYKFSPIKGFTK